LGHIPRHFFFFDWSPTSDTRFSSPSHVFRSPSDACVVPPFIPFRRRSLVNIFSFLKATYQLGSTDFSLNPNSPFPQILLRLRFGCKAFSPLSFRSFSPEKLIDQSPALTVWSPFPLPSPAAAPTLFPGAFFHLVGSVPSKRYWGVSWPFSHLFPRLRISAAS